MTRDRQFMGEQVQVGRFEDERRELAHCRRGFLCLFFGLALQFLSPAGLPDALPEGASRSLVDAAEQAEQGRTGTWRVQAWTMSLVGAFGGLVPAGVWLAFAGRSPRWRRGAWSLVAAAVMLGASQALLFLIPSPVHPISEAAPVWLRLLWGVSYLPIPAILWAGTMLTAEFGIACRSLRLPVHARRLGYVVQALAIAVLGLLGWVVPHGIYVAATDPVAFALISAVTLTQLVGMLWLLYLAVQAVAIARYFGLRSEVLAGTDGA